MLTMNELLEAAKIQLRERRLKYGCDYTWLIKYGHLHVLCHRVYEDTIREVLTGLQFLPFFHCLEDY